MTFKYATKSKAYTPEEDRFLVCMINQIGYGNFEELKMEIRKAWEFRFDWFFKSRTAVELQRRCDSLIRVIEKEDEDRTGIRTSKPPSRRGRKPGSTKAKLEAKKKAAAAAAAAAAAGDGSGDGDDNDDDDDDDVDDDDDDDNDDDESGDDDSETGSDRKGKKRTAESPSSRSSKRQKTDD